MNKKDSLLLSLSNTNNTSSSSVVSLSKTKAMAELNRSLSSYLNFKNQSLYSKILLSLKYIRLQRIQVNKTRYLLEYLIQVRKSSTKINFMTKAKEKKLGIFFKGEKTYQAHFLRKLNHIHIGIVDISSSSLAIQRRTEKRLKENIFAKITHEVKTPITILMNMNSQILSNINKNSINRAIEMCNFSISYSLYLNHQVNDMISFFSDKSLNSLHINKVNISLKDLLNEAYGILNSLVYLCSERKFIQTEICIKEELRNHFFRGDYDIISQIVCHLLTNAVKFTQNGGISIECGVEIENKAKSDLSVVTPKQQMPDAIKVMKYSSFNTKFENPLKQRTPLKTFFIKIKNHGCFITESLRKIISGSAKVDSSININTNYNETCGLGLGLKIVKKLCDLINVDLSLIEKNNYFEASLAFPYQDEAYYNTDKYNVQDNESSILSNSDISIDSNASTVKTNKPPILCFSIKNLVEFEIFSSKRNNNTSIYTSRHLVDNCVCNGLIKSNQIRKIHFQHVESINYSPFPSENKDLIIICDDYEPIRTSHRNIIESFTKDQYFTICCKDGIELIKVVYDCKYHNKSIKAIFTDENMETMNGSNAVEIINSLAEKNKLQRIKSFSITAFEDEETRKKILSKGLIKILSKPLKKKLIESLLIEYGLI